MRCFIAFDLFVYQYHVRGDVTAKMADSLGVGVSEVKDPENDDHDKVKCSWAGASGAGKVNVASPEVKMAETLGFYEKIEAQGEQRDRSGKLEHQTDLRFSFQRVTLTDLYLDLTPALLDCSVFHIYSF